MKKILLILGVTNFIAIETSLIISCSDKLIKPIERPKQAINPTQCGNSCKLEFLKIGKSAWVISGFSLNLYHLEIDATNLKLSSDFDIQIGNGDFIQRPALKLFVDKDSVGYNQINNFYRSNGSYEPKHHAKIYFIDKLINFKVLLNQDLNTKVFYVTSFSADLPSLPEKDNEQSLPIEQPKPRADHLKI